MLTTFWCVTSLKRCCKEPNLMKCPSWKGKNQHTNLWPTNLDPETTIFVKLSPTCLKHFFNEKINSSNHFMTQVYIWNPIPGTLSLKTLHPTTSGTLPSTSFHRGSGWWCDDQTLDTKKKPWSRKTLHHCQRKLFSNQHKGTCSGEKKTWDAPPKNKDVP